MTTILIFIIVLGLLVFVHELGHFVVARRNGINAEEFGFGFPPRMIGIHRDDQVQVWRFLIGNKEIILPRVLRQLLALLRVRTGEERSPHTYAENTVYSLNWIPLGGFVKIKGEGGEHKFESDSFANKPAWVRIKVLSAGVVMNFLLAWVLLSSLYMLGFPQPIGPEERGKYPDEKVQILEVKHATPAEAMGLKPLDEIIALNDVKPVGTEGVIKGITEHKGKELAVTVLRGKDTLVLKGTPRTEYPANEGALGITLSETALVSAPWYEAILRGAETTIRITGAILQALGNMLLAVIGAGEKVALDVTGPVGIVYLTKQMSDMGFVYLLWFAAILSINLGIFNILPIPALDGGRVLFVLIEKFRGTPVSHEVEGRVHQIGFILLLFLMLLVTIRDFSQFKLLEKIHGLFL